MLQEDQISKLTKLKELLDAGVLTEEEFTQEKAKVMANARMEQSSSDILQQQKIQTREVRQASIPNSVIGPANVGLSPGLVLSLGILAIVLSIAGSVFSALYVSDYFDYPPEFDATSFICDFLSIIALFILWACAFKKISSSPNGDRLGGAPIWMYLYLGFAALATILSYDALEAEPILGIVVIFVALVFGYVSHILLYKAYTEKMRTYSMAWMVGMGLGLIMALVGADIVSTIIEAGVYVFLMIALLEKQEA